MGNCTNFTHPTEEQFQLLDILSNNNKIYSILFELIHYLIRADSKDLIFTVQQILWAKSIFTQNQHLIKFNLVGYKAKALTQFTNSNRLNTCFIHWE